MQMIFELLWTDITIALADLQDLKGISCLVHEATTKSISFSNSDRSLKWLQAYALCVVWAGMGCQGAWHLGL